MAKKIKQAESKPHLENDFERMIPEYHKSGIIYAEHIVRYKAAADIVKGKVILDIASGSGYGTALLSKSAAKVYGVDVSADAVAYAQAHYGASNISYSQGDGQKIPLEDATVDIVVSFETIEHIKDYKQFIEEVKRVLKPDGLLLLSTPNDKEFAEGNHFHLHEFKYEELHSLMRGYFSHIKDYFQGTWICSAIGDEMLMGSEWDMSIMTQQAAPIVQDKVLYFFMLCANRPIKEVVTPRNAIGEHWSARFIKKERDKSEAVYKQKQYYSMLVEAELERVRIDRDRLHYELSEVKKSKVWILKTKLRAIQRMLTPKK